MAPIRVSGMCLVAVVGWFTLALSTFAADAGPASDQFSDHAIELPKYVVTDARELPPPESWHYARVDSVEILSSAPEATTRRLISDWQDFRQMLDVVWPMPRRMNAPLMLILCGRSGEFDSFCPAHADDDPRVGRATLQLAGERRSAIILDVQTRVLTVDVLSASAGGTDTSALRVDHAQQLRREYLRFLLAGTQPRLPAWFEEGMAQVAMNIEHDKHSISVGKIEQADSVSAEAAMYALDQWVAAKQGATAGGFSPPPADEKDFNGALAKQALLPMERFLSVPHGARETQNPLGSNRWMKQAYAFVHMGLFGEEGRWRKPFAEFLLRSTREPLSETMFKECFKKSYRDMESELRGYVQFTAYSAVVFKAKGGATIAKPAPVEVRDATPVEVGCIKGAAQLLADHTAAARVELIAPYTRGERDSRLLAALGLLEHASGKDDRARKLLEAAVAAKCQDAAAYVELARFQYADASAAPASPDHQRFSAAQIADITRLLLTARSLDAANLSVYELLADTLSRSSVPLQERDLLPLIEGSQRFPKHFRLIYQTAGLCANAGLTNVANTFADHGIKYAPDVATRVQFEQLKAKLPKRATK